VDPSVSRVLDRIDRFCDAVPRRWAEAVDDGPLRLFVRSGPGWPFYARPVPGGGPVRAEDVVRMRTRQRALRVPESVEWVPAAAPTVLDAVRATGLRVSLCPLLVLDGDPLPVPFPPGCAGRLLGPADGDLVAASVEFGGTHRGEFQGIPPTNKRVSFTGIEVNRMVDGKVEEHWVELDLLGMMQQLGLVVVPGPRLLGRMLVHQAKRLRSRLSARR